MRKTRHIAPPELDRLEVTIRRLLDAHDAWRARALAAERRVSELEAMMREIGSGDVDPIALARQVEQLEERNRELQDRLERGQEAVQRMLARLQFAEEVR